MVKKGWKKLSGSLIKMIVAVCILTFMLLSNFLFLFFQALMQLIAVFQVGHKFRKCYFLLNFRNLEAFLEKKKIFQFF